jgi:steroid delta-isomerase-like uncharacterized protein
MCGASQATAIVNALLDAWNARDLDRFTALLTEDVYWHDLGMFHPPAEGREAVRRFCETVLRAFPDFRLDIRHQICVAEDGTRFVIPWTITATNTGPLEPPGMAPTGRKVSFSGFDYVEIRDQKVARIETRFDLVETAEQLMGLRLRPRAGSWTERCLVLAQRCLAAWVRRRNRATPQLRRT